MQYVTTYKVNKENVFTKCIGTATSLCKEVLKATHLSKTLVTQLELPGQQRKVKD